MRKGLTPCGRVIGYTSVTRRLLLPQVRESLALCGRIVKWRQTDQALALEFERSDEVIRGLFAILQAPAVTRRLHVG